MSEYLLEVKNLKKHFPIHGGIFLRQTGNVYALDGVSFGIKKGETLGVVGESGCGKTTLGRTLLKLYNPTSGQIFFNQEEITNFSLKQMRKIRRSMQMIFQDPFESLNSRHTVGQILEEPFIIHDFGSRQERQEKIGQLLDVVELPLSSKDKYPHEFSGGQRQRIGIARAMALEPQLIVCDEPVSALDVSIQSQILNLLLELQSEKELTYLFISHDLSVVKHISDKIIVMYLGHIVEINEAQAMLNDPIHPYTQALISAIPIPDPTARKKKTLLTGDVPSPITPPPGCKFNTRCPYVKDICVKEMPQLQNYSNQPSHLVACHFAGEIQ